MDRRQFLRLGTAVAASAFAGSSLWQRAIAALVSHPAQAGPSPYGPLLEPDENGIMLPAGFRSRVIARARQLVPGTDYTWHLFPDGGATYLVDDGWIYVSNSEFIIAGGVGAIRFNRGAEIVDAYSICSGTFQNCAGGKTAWNTWLTCEEIDNGRVFECDPTGRRESVVRPALGTFKHEAAAVDFLDRRLYLTEDVPNGRFYRFTPNQWANLDDGLLEVAEVDPEGRVRWHPVPNPNPNLPAETPTRIQVAESTPFNGGEGIVYYPDHVYFTTKGDNRVWDYQPSTQRICVLYDAALDPARQLTGVDNITTSVLGDLVVAEDGGNMELVLITRDLVAAPIVRVVGQDMSEITGPAFDPWERRLYFSSQRGDGVGITYEVRGPFRQRFRC